jgi:hypothetical protein
MLQEWTRRLVYGEIDFALNPTAVNLYIREVTHNSGGSITVGKYLGVTPVLWLFMFQNDLKLVSIMHLQTRS